MHLPEAIGSVYPPWPMLLVYIDDAGDPGVQSSSPTKHLVLTATLIRAEDWRSCLDGLIELRGRLYDRYGLPVRKPLKARHFVAGGGPFWNLELSQRSRIRILRGIYRYQVESLPVRTFAVAIDKEGAQRRGWEPMQAAWTFLLQRLQRFAEENGELAMLLTEANLIPVSRRLVRHMRRHHRVPFLRNEGAKQFNLSRIVEDPLPGATDGYFLELADWNAYAALRSQYVAPQSKQTTGLWDLLGEVRVSEVSKIRKGPPGLVIYPDSDGARSPETLNPK